MKCYQFSICLWLVLILSSGAIGQTATVIVPSGLDVSENSTLQVSIKVTTSEDIGLSQFIVEYDTSLVSFVNADIGPDASGFTVSLVNTSLPFPPTTSGTTDNVLVQISGGGGNSFTGTDKSVAILNFQSMITKGISPLAFDQGTNKTFLTTTSLVDINGDSLTFVDGQVTVPVQLFSFTAQVERDGVKLRWVIAYASSNFGFEIQHSKNKSNFEKIGFVSSVSVTTDSKIYSFIHRPADFGTHYYRLKQIDINGSFEHLGLLQVVVSRPENFELSQNYPNPFNQGTLIQYQLNAMEHTVLVIYNLLGKNIRRLVDEQQGPGYYSVMWNGKNDAGVTVPSGVYIYELRTSNFVAHKRMILMK